MNNLTHMALTIETWYQSINKPFWAPPVWAFGVVWTVIYPLIIVSFSYVFWQSFVTHRWRRYIGLLFAINLLANAVYTIGVLTVFNDQKSLADIRDYYWPAALVISVVLTTLPTMIVATWDRARWVALLQIPYLFWILVATMLQLSINFAN